LSTLPTVGVVLAFRAFANESSSVQVTLIFITFGIVLQYQFDALVKADAQ